MYVDIDVICRFEFQKECRKSVGRITGFAYRGARFTVPIENFEAGLRVRGCKLQLSITVGKF